jgi:hypothetical protein
MKVKRNKAYAVIDMFKRGEPLLREEIQQELGLTKVAANRHLKELWVLDLIYISGWDRAHHEWAPRYRWGNKPDVSKPAPLTPSEVYTREVERHGRRASRKANLLPRTESSAA